MCFKSVLYEIMCVFVGWWIEVIRSCCFVSCGMIGYIWTGKEANVYHFNGLTTVSAMKEKKKDIFCYQVLKKKQQRVTWKAYIILVLIHMLQLKKIMCVTVGWNIYSST